VIFKDISLDVFNKPNKLKINKYESPKKLSNLKINNSEIFKELKSVNSICNK